MNNVGIIEWHRDYHKNFSRLSLEWLEKYGFKRASLVENKYLEAYIKMELTI